MGSLRAILMHPDDIYPLMKLKVAARYAEKKIPSQPHWAFCYIMLDKVSRSFSLVIQQLPVELRDADDTSVATEVKVPILMAFDRHVYDREWHFSCLTAKVIDRTRTMADVYGAFFDFCCIFKSKVEYRDPNVAKILKRLEVILRTSKYSGTLNKRKSYVIQSGPSYSSTLVVVLVVIVAMLLGYQSETGLRPCD